jgi:membrane protein DedA with SNARE-associated domain
MATGIIGALNAVALWFVVTFGYVGVAVSMTLESALIPIPSEVVMPYAGFVQYLQGTGIPGVLGVTLAATLGNVAGSWILYRVSRKEGDKIIAKLERFKLVRQSEIERSKRWFAKYGSITIFFARLTPGLRTVVGLPAGLMNMSERNLIVFTLLGSIPWNFALAYAGYLAGPKWNTILAILQQYEIPIYVIVVVIVVIAIIYFYKGGKPREKETRTTTSPQEKKSVEGEKSE